MRKQIPYIVFLIIGCLGVLICANPIISGFQFCTPNDEIFQTIEDNAENWQAYFASMTEDEPPVLRFSVSGKDHVVFTKPWDTKDSSTLFIPVIDLRQESLGSMGYIYSSSNRPLEDWRYEIEHIRGNVSCYRIT